MSDDAWKSRRVFLREPGSLWVISTQEAFQCLTGRRYKIKTNRRGEHYIMAPDAELAGHARRWVQPSN